MGFWRVPGSDGLVHEILYWVSKNDPSGPSPSNPAADPQFERWDAPVRAKYGAYGIQPQPPQPLQPLIPIIQQPMQPSQPQYQNPYGGSLIPL